MNTRGTVEDRLAALAEDFGPNEALADAVMARISAEPALPKGVTENDDRMRARAAVLRGPMYTRGIPWDPVGSARGIGPRCA